MGAQRYSPEFKQTVVEELLAGAKRPGQLCREHGIDFSTLRKWREQYAQQGLAAWTPAPAKTATVGEDKIAELERVIGQLTVENMQTHSEAPPTLAGRRTAVRRTHMRACASSSAYQPRPCPARAARLIVSGSPTRASSWTP